MKVTTASELGLTTPTKWIQQGGSEEDWQVEAAIVAVNMSKGESDFTKALFSVFGMAWEAHRSWVEANQHLKVIPQESLDAMTSKIRRIMASCGAPS